MFPWQLSCSFLPILLARPVSACLLDSSILQATFFKTRLTLASPAPNLLSYLCHHLTKRYRTTLHPVAEAIRWGPVSSPAPSIYNYQLESCPFFRTNPFPCHLSTYGTFAWTLIICPLPQFPKSTANFEPLRTSFLFLQSLAYNQGFSALFLHPQDGAWCCWWFPCSLHTPLPSLTPTGPSRSPSTSTTLTTSITFS